MQIAKLLLEIFHGSMDAYGIYRITGTEVRGEGIKLVGEAATIRRPVTEELWQSHIDGKQAIGIIPIDSDNKTFFGAIDIDIYPMDYAEMAAKIRTLKLPLVPVKTKSGGMHLYLFMKEKISCAMIQARLLDFAIKLGHGDKEIFPKQKEVKTERGDVGVFINSPYFNIKDGRSTRCGVYPDGTEMDIADFIEEAKSMQQTVEQLMGFTLDLINEMVDGPPCLQHLIGKKVTSGNRNIVLTNIGRYLRKADQENMVSRGHEFNNLYFDPPLADAEVTSTVQSAGKKDYEYNCNKSPLKQHCNKELCQTRKYGVSRLLTDSFQLENLTKYNSDPPIWFVNIQGLGVRLELSTEDLQSQVRFQSKCLNAANMYPPKLSNNAWLSMMQNLLQKVTIIEASKDTSPRGQFFELLEKFCTNRVQAKSKDELLLGKPWLNEGRHYFKLSNVMEYLDRNHFKEFKVHQIASMLKEKGGETGFFNVKNKGINWWSIPEFPKQTEGFDVQGIAKESGM